MDFNTFIDFDQAPLVACDKAACERPIHVCSISQEKVADWLFGDQRGLQKCRGKVDDLISKRCERQYPHPDPASSSHWFFQGTFFHLEIRDGSDTFLLGSSYWLFMTERVKLALVDAKISGVHFFSLVENTDFDLGGAEGFAKPNTYFSRAQEAHPMDFNKFFYMELDTVDFPLQVEFTSSIDFDQARLIARGEVDYKEPIHVRALTRGRATDYLTSDRPWIGIYSAKFFDILQSGGFTGWSSLPVHVEGIAQEQQDSFRALVVHGRSGEFDRSLSKKCERRYPHQKPEDPPSSFLKGTFFHPETWDGSDIFMPGPSCWLFMTERVKLALVDAKISGVQFLSLVENEWF